MLSFSTCGATARAQAFFATATSPAFAEAAADDELAAAFKDANAAMADMQDAGIDTRVRLTVGPAVRNRLKCNMPYNTHLA